ncbi:MAG: pyrroline-5-carboxylate reductase [Caldicoprobacter oshimai]|uniref:Pyrroline-5-carboxylate reductase n=1 Tax=Caldicoprobacter faecalis TaxID=937334 RepID=A0A1I5RT60_9FIRM|nr:pyrroline-5-carboxylate reductase [Caldicoprobacter faecalis]PZN11734.1 MAG: pyrroline-5-carboxylate reductase [Caldicoprobacter oshimai]SFP61451.1 pyrroline-5-carboxylate reductase [Caldicoprobacter faecalis]
MPEERKSYSLGFIGAGNMASAIMRGIITCGIVHPNNICAFDVDLDKLNRLSAELGIRTAKDNCQVVSNSDIVILAVKPNTYSKVLLEIKDCLEERHILISIAAGISVDFIKQLIGGRCKVVRTMPNTPALVGEGMTALCTNHDLSPKELEAVKEILHSLGKVEEVPENLMDAVTAVSGSGPAYVAMFIEAMADGGVLAGLPRDLAYRMAIQTVIGTARLLSEWEKHPGEVKDMVSSPGGTTIEAVRHLEKQGFRGAVIEAVNACALKSQALGKTINHVKDEKTR